MLTVFGFLIQLTGFFILYNTSHRAVFVRRKINSWIRQHLVISKVLGMLMMIAAIVVFIFALGITVGLLVALTSVMTISALIIILYPLPKDKSVE